MEQIGHIAIHRWFKEGEGWAYDPYFSTANKLSDSVNDVTSAIRGESNKLYHVPPTDGKSGAHHYVFNYADTACEDPKAIGRDPRNSIVIRFDKPVPESALPELEEQLKALPLPADRAAQGSAKIIIKGEELLPQLDYAIKGGGRATLVAEAAADIGKTHAGASALEDTARGERAASGIVDRAKDVAKTTAEKVKGWQHWNIVGYGAMIAAAAVAVWALVRSKTKSDDALKADDNEPASAASAVPSPVGQIPAKEKNWAVSVKQPTEIQAISR